MTIKTIGQCFDDLDERINEHLRKQITYKQLLKETIDEDVRRGAESMMVIEGLIVEELREIRSNFTALGATWL